MFGSLENKRETGVWLAVWVDLWGGIMVIGFTVGLILIWIEE